MSGLCVKILDLLEDPLNFEQIQSTQKVSRDQKIASKVSIEVSEARESEKSQKLRSLHDLESRFSIRQESLELP